MPGVITEIRTSRKNPSRASILVDGKFVMTLSHLRISDMGLAIGMAWDDTLAAELLQAKAMDKATKAAMNRLNRRPMSRSQLRKKLIEKEHTPEVVDQVLDKAEAVGALNDENFARTLAREYTLHRHAGPAMLRVKLRAKGITREVIDAIVSEFEQDDIQVQQAMRLGEKKLRSLSRCDGPTRKRRLYGALARRGYTRDVIEQVMNELLSDREED